MDLTEAKMYEPVLCYYCMEKRHVHKLAAYDGKTVDGPWTYMCEEHFQVYGVGLGTGKGQRLIFIEKEEEDIEDN